MREQGRAGSGHWSGFHEWISGQVREIRMLIKRAGFPDWIPPMRTRRARKPFSGGDWLFERLFEGIRCIGFKCGRRVRLLSWDRRELGGFFPEVARALGEVDVAECVVDGTLVAFEQGLASRALLGQRMAGRCRGVRTCYYLFDLLYINGLRITGLDLEARKQMLDEYLTYRACLRPAPFRRELGEEYFGYAFRRGWSGVVAKRVHSPYRAGRAGGWLEISCLSSAVFIVGGYLTGGEEACGVPAASGSGPAGLLLGRGAGGSLRFAGEVRVGVPGKRTEWIAGTLRGLERDSCPFEERPRVPGARWVEPELRAAVDFTGWEGRRVRHPRFRELLQGQTRIRPPRRPS
jgi:ATP-dependent DNA ligase